MNPSFLNQKRNTSMMSSPIRPLHGDNNNDKNPLGASPLIDDDSELPLTLAVRRYLHT